MNDEPTAMKSPSDLVEELVSLVEQAIEITAQAVRQGLSDELNALTDNAVRDKLSQILNNAGRNPAEIDSFLPGPRLAAELVADPGFDY